MGLNRPGWRIFLGSVFILFLTTIFLFTGISEAGSVGPRVASGYSHSVFINSDGTLWAWGSNKHGQLGDGTTIDSYTPIQISTDNDWIAVAAGALYTLALKADGTLWGWGNNENGELGDNTTKNKLLPVQISMDSKGNPFTDLVSIAAGAFHVLAVKSDGTLWAWGNNQNGRLGDNTITNRLLPVQIGIDTNWLSVAAGSEFSLAIKLDGTLWAWGKNENGQLGDNKTIDVKKPQQVETDMNGNPFAGLISVAAGGEHSLAIKQDGTLWAWGYNYYGQLGDNSTTRRLMPVQVGTDINWMFVAGGFYHTVALKSDGTLWAWGDNTLGSLGDGTTTDSPVPIQIDTGWNAIAPGWCHNLAMKTDGTLWAWGDNQFGQVGNGAHGSLVTKADVLSPAEISLLPGPGTLNPISPTDGSVFAACTLINTYQPSFEWNPSDTFQSFTLIFLADGVVVSSVNVKGTKTTYTLPIATWNTILKKSWNGGSIQNIYWKLVGTKAGLTGPLSKVKDGLISFQIGPAQAATIILPTDGSALSAAAPPTFTFQANCNTSFTLEFSNQLNITDSTKTKTFSYSVKDPNTTPTLSETLTSDQWNSVKSLVGSGTGYFRIKAKDALSRQTISLINSFTIGP